MQRGWSGARRIRELAVFLLPSVAVAGLCQCPPATAGDIARDRELDEHVSRFTAEIEASPQKPDAYFMRAHALRAQSKFEAALSDYNQAIKLGLRNYQDQLYEGEGVCNFKLNKLKQAINDFNRALKLNPGLFEARKLRAAALLRAGQPGPALGDIDVLLALAAHRRNSSLYLSRARIYSALGQYQKALADIKTASAVNKDDIFIPIELARVHLALKEPQKAMLALNSAAGKCSSMGEYWGELALAHYGLANYESVVGEANKAKELGYQTADLWAAAADSAAHSGHADQAVGFATSALGLNPDCALALFVRGQSWKKLSREDLARADLGRAAALGYAPTAAVSRQTEK